MKFQKKVIKKKFERKPVAGGIINYKLPDGEPSYSMPPEMFFIMFIEWNMEVKLNQPVLPESFMHNADVSELCIKYGVKSFKYKDGCYFLTLT